MKDDQAVNEMTSAFAAGCMDKENFVNFYNFMKSSGDIPYKELGRLQLLSAMLPAILEPEYPKADLKNKVARALISMQDEIKEKIKIEREKPAPAENQEPVINESDNNLNRNPQPDTRISAVKNVMENQGPVEQEQNNYLNASNRLFTENVYRMPEPPSFTPVWIVVALLFLGVCGLAYYCYTGLSELKEASVKSENSIAALKNELRNTTDFINRNSVLIDFFNYENIWSLQLNGQDPVLKITGKLFIAQVEKEALLQMTNLPTPSPEETYQLWIVTKGQTISMGVFFIAPGSRFVKISNIPIVPQEQIQQIKITLEPRGGSPAPTGQTYAAGPEWSSVKRK